MKKVVENYGKNENKYNMSSNAEQTSNCEPPLEKRKIAQNTMIIQSNILAQIWNKVIDHETIGSVKQDKNVFDKKIDDEH